MNLLKQIVAYEAGELADEDVIEFFQHLLDTGVIFNLQGNYHRTANDLVAAGLISYRGQADV